MRMPRDVIDKASRPLTYSIWWAACMCILCRILVHRNEASRLHSFASGRAPRIRCLVLHLDTWASSEDGGCTFVLFVAIAHNCALATAHEELESLAARNPGRRKSGMKYNVPRALLRTRVQALFGRLD